MNAKNDQSPKGAEFERQLKLSNYKKAQFAMMLGKTNYPGQTTNNWIARGVPTSLAIKAAELLGCSPTDISDIQAPTRDIKTSKIYNKKADIKADFSIFIEAIEDEEKLKALDNALKSIKELLSHGR